MTHPAPTPDALAAASTRFARDPVLLATLYRTLTAALRQFAEPPA